MGKVTMGSLFLENVEAVRRGREQFRCFFATKVVSTYCIPPREKLPAAVALSPTCYLP